MSEDVVTASCMHLLAEMEGEETFQTGPADDVDIMNDADGTDQAPARKNRKAAVVDSDEEDEVELREAEPAIDTQAQGPDDVADNDVNMAEAFGSESDDDGV